MCIDPLYWNMPAHVGDFFFCLSACLYALCEREQFILLILTLYTCQRHPQSEFLCTRVHNKAFNIYFVFFCCAY